MKKTLFIILFINIVSILNAQTQRKSNNRFSLVLNPQISWLNSDHADIEGKGTLFGYNCGIIIDHFFDTNYAISTGLTVNTIGGKLRYKNGGDFIVGGKDVKLEPNDILTYQLKYIEIPLSIKLQTNDQKRISIYGVFGLAGDINIKTNNGSGKSLSNEVRDLFASYHIGGGLQYSLGGDTYLTTGLKYNQGITDITYNKNFKDATHLNSVVLQLGFIF